MSDTKKPRKYGPLTLKQWIIFAVLAIILIPLSLYTWNIRTKMLGDMFTKHSDPKTSFRFY